MSLGSDHTALVSHGVTAGLASVFVSSWAGLVPPLAAAGASLLAVIWYAIQIWESQTVKRWRRNAGLKIPADIDTAEPADPAGRA
jgi:hypothetical protein